VMPSLELASPESRPPIIHSRTGRMTSYPIVDDLLIAEGGRSNQIVGHGRPKTNPDTPRILGPRAARDGVWLTTRSSIEALGVVGWKRLASVRPRRWL